MKLSSVCPLDCPDTCSLSVTVEDDRVVAVLPDQNRVMEALCREDLFTVGSRR